MKTLNQKGISTVAIIFIVVVILLAGGVVWWISSQKVNRNNKSNTNTNSVINTNIDTSKWPTYDSSKSTLYIFKEFKPAFQFKYPSELIMTEDRLGVYLTEEITGSSIQPEILIGSVDENQGGDILTWCKEKAKYGRNWDSPKNYLLEKIITIDGIKSAYIKFNYPEHQNDNTTYVCIPKDDIIFGVSGIPYDSDIVTRYFDKILETIQFSD
ncbi:MAG: hypothetical protein PHI73_03760 [Patescibacteria group bacterium]|nr:hypothetical protein [Patescibacteria group bacterium]